MGKLYTGHHIANAVLSIFVLLCGVTMSILLNVLIGKAVSYSTQPTSYGYQPSSPSMIYSTNLWAVGFAYIIPGITGFVAALVRNKCVFITQTIFGILTLIFMGLGAIGGIIILGTLATGPSCVTSGDLCNCGDDMDDLLSHNCEQLNELYGIGIGTIVAIVFGWFMTLAATVVGCVLACRNDTQPGVIIYGAPTSCVQVSTQQTFSHPGYEIPVVPPTYDRAQLINNAAY